MGISYAGVDLLLPDPGGEVQQWLDRFMSLEDLRLFGGEPMAIRSQRTSSRTGYKSGNGLPLPNYPAAPPTRINSLWWPTGASRWGRANFLASAAQKDAVMAACSSGDGLSNSPQNLVIGDPNQATVTASGMYLLPPRPVACSGDLWLLSLVDARYWWQFIPMDYLSLTSASTWADLFGAVSTALGLSITYSAVHADYLNTDPDELSRSFANAAMFFDAISHSVGKRVVFGLDGTCASLLASEALEVLAANEELQNWTRAAGATFHNEPGNRPANVRVVFPKFESLKPNCSGIVRFVDVAIGGLAGTYKTIFSSCWADYTTDPTAGEADNQDKLDALANRIATDYAAWLDKKIDLTFNGILNWAPTGFEDGIQFDFGRQLPDLQYLASTRVISLPWDFGVEQNLSQDSEVPVYEPPLLLRAPEDAMVAYGDSGTFRVFTGIAGSESDSGDEVEAFNHGPDIFRDEFCLGIVINCKWYAESINRIVRGTLYEALAQGDSALIDVEGATGDQVTVHDYLMKVGMDDLPIGTKIVASWDQLSHQWIVIAAECP